MRKLKRKYSKPRKPWEKQRILEEKELIKEYAYKNKREIWKMKSIIKRYRDFAKKLVSIRTAQEAKEKKEFLESLYKKGLIEKDAEVDDVLALTIRDISERRLQTLVYRKGLARTPKHARQLIVHGHVYVNNKKITSPSAIIGRDEENLIRVENLGVKDEQKD